MDITTKNLSEKVYGTGCGTVPEHLSSLSHNIIIDFIDRYFGGVLDGVETYTENGHELLLEGCPHLVKLNMSKSEFEYFTKSISNDFYNDTIETVIDIFDINKNEVVDDDTDLFDEDNPDLICLILSLIVDYYGGSIRCEYMYSDDGEVDLESE